MHSAFKEATVKIRPSLAQDLLSIQRQPSQRSVLGLDARFSIEEADAHAGSRFSRTAIAGGRILCCFGILEAFPGKQGLAWAIFAADLRAHHVVVTRAARALVEGCGLARVEAVTACSDIEPLAAFRPDFDNWQLTRAALEAPTAEMRWAQLVGLKPAHVLRRYGGRSETCMLFERLASLPVASRAEKPAPTSSGRLP